MHWIIEDEELQIFEGWQLCNGKVFCWFLEKIEKELNISMLVMFM